MTCTYRRIAAVAVMLGLAGAPAQAQFYGGGYWGGGAQTVAGNQLQGAGMYAMGMGRYNVETAQARSINANTAMRWNQYMYESTKESERNYHALMAKKEAKDKTNGETVRTRLRDNPNSYDITSGNALNVVLVELTNPGLFPKAVDYGGKMKLGGETIRDIPFQYASAAITVSVHQLTQGGPPAALKGDEFGPDRDKLKALAAELRKEGEELGTPKPETIKKAKDQIMATKAKAEATLPKNSQELRDAEKYIKALYGLASMLETPAVNVLLAGVEKRPDATLGDLLGFMTSYNLRFGASDTPRQREIYLTLYPMLVKLRNDLGPAPGSAAQASPDAPGAVFGDLGYNHTETKVPAPPAPK